MKRLGAAERKTGDGTMGVIEIILAGFIGLNVILGLSSLATRKW